MRKIKMLLWCIVLCLGIGTAAAMADSGVTILSSPKRVDLYRTYENTFYSGSIRYQLDEDAVVTKHSITQYRDLVGFDMDVIDEGNRVYRVDLQGFYTRLTMETFGLPDVMDFTFGVETKTGSQSVTFPVHLHEDVWDARRVDIRHYEGGDVKIGDRVEILKPTLDGKAVRTGLINGRIEGHAHHHPDPFFGNGWVNDFSYSTNVLRLVDETGDAFILEAIASGSAETICTVREINSNASLSVINADFMVRPNDPAHANIAFSIGSSYKVRFPLQAGSFESDQLQILIEDSGSYSDTLDAEFEYEAYIRDTDIVSEVEFLEAKPSNSRKAIVFRYKLKGAKRAGETQLVIRVTYKGAVYNCEIPVVVYDENMEVQPEDSLHMERTWSNFYFNLAYCNELDTELELELGADYECLSGEEEHAPEFAYELLDVKDDCPYAISFSERGEDSARVLVNMKPKAMPLKTGRYSYAVRYTVTCCGETKSIEQTVPVLIVDIPENKLDYLHTPPAYMCLDRDSVYWDREILTPINRYCDLKLKFYSGINAWPESHYDRYLVYKPEEAGQATWSYTAAYANGEKVLHSGETMIFERDDVGRDDELVTAIRNSFDLTPKQRKVPRLFPADQDWNQEWFLKAQIIHTGAENAVCYELTLVDEYENEVELPESTTLYLPYPENMTAEVAAKYEFVVVHEAKSGTQIYSTQEGSLIRREYGLEMTVDSLSPFTINWGTEEEMNALLPFGADTSALPQTGDNSHIAHWLALLTLAGSALVCIKRKAA